MTNKHIEKFLINDTNVDFNMKLPVYEILRLLQVATFNHSNLIGLDHKTMQEKSNAFWVVTKMKLKINNNIFSGDNVKVSTWTQPLSTIRAIRDFNIKIKNRVLVKATAEWCCLDCDTRKIRKLNSIVYPNLIMEETSSSNLEFSKQKVEFFSKDFIYTRTIKSTDIDINQHTNNLKYNFMAIDAFSVDELNSFDIKEYEIHFVNETRLDENIDVYKKKAGSSYFIEGRSNEKIVFSVIIKTKKKES